MELPISAEMLAKRWGLKPIDLFFIMWNHDLKVLTQSGNLIDVDEVLNMIPQDKRDQRFAIEDRYFSLNQVNTLEKSYVGDLLSKKHEVVRGQQLIDNWELDDFALHTIASQKGWDFVDPFGQTIGGAFFLAMCAHGNFKISEAWFKASDVEEFEKEEFGKYQKGSEINVAVDNDDTNAISFYKNGQIWKIGECGRESDFTNLKGYEYINFLIKNRGKEIDVFQVESLGQVSPDNADFESGHTPEGINLTAHQVISESDCKDASDGIGQYGYQEIKDFLPQELIDDATESDIKKTLEAAEEQLSSVNDPFETVAITERIKFLKDYLKKTKIPSNKKQKFRSNRLSNCRTKIQKAIKKALETIDNEVPELTEYLNNETITTGAKCSYSQDPAKPVRWILDPQ